MAGHRCGVEVILGCNGYIWLAPPGPADGATTADGWHGGTTVAAADGSTAGPPVVPFAVRETVCSGTQRDDANRCLIYIACPT